MSLKNGAIKWLSPPSGNDCPAYGIGLSPKDIAPSTLT